MPTFLHWHYSSYSGRREKIPTSLSRRQKQERNISRFCGTHLCPLGPGCELGNGAVVMSISNGSLPPLWIYLYLSITYLSIVYLPSTFLCFFLLWLNSLGFSLSRRFSLTDLLPLFCSLCLISSVMFVLFCFSRLLSISCLTLFVSLLSFCLCVCLFLFLPLSPPSLSVWLYLFLSISLPFPRTLPCVCLCQSFCQSFSTCLSISA